MYQLTKLENNLESVLKNFSITEKIDIKLTRNESFDLQINNLVKFKDNPNLIEIIDNFQRELDSEPFIKKYVNDTESSWAGWEVHQVVSPTGNAYNWSIATVDHFTTLSGALNPFPEGAEWPEGLEAINDLLPDGKFYKSVIYEVVFYEGT